MSLHVHIDHLVLEGLPLEFRGQAAFQSALEGELGRVLARRGLAQELAGGAALPRIEGGSLSLSGSTAPGPLGRQAGGHLAGALAGGGKP